MNNKTRDAIESLKEAILEEAGKNAVSCTVFFNCHEYEYKIKYRTAESLNADGISMRNLSGDWIR